jgi:hypothetical protein
MRRGHRGLLGIALTVVMATSASTAYAGSDPWFSGNLAAGFGYASAGAHSITYIEGDANYNGFCVAKDQGISGYDFASRTPAGTPTCASSGGFAARSENGACCYHGWIANGLGNAITVFTSTHYNY